jgi:predicted HTH domain antitoxin
MATISFEIPDGVLTALNEEPGELSAQVRELAAIQLFKAHKLSIGKAAELAGMNKYAFIQELAKNGIPAVDYDPAELQQEMNNFP